VLQHGRPGQALLAAKQLERLQQALAAAALHCLQLSLNICYAALQSSMQSMHVDKVLLIVCVCKSPPLEVWQRLAARQLHNSNASKGHGGAVGDRNEQVSLPCLHAGHH
jgi:hypothetical protein